MAESLADKIAGILTAAPANFDPEDDNVDSTKARIVESGSRQEETSDEDEQIISKLRQANVELLGDIDKSYAGKKTSRKNLQDSDSENDSDRSEVDDEDSGESEDEDESNEEAESAAESLEEEFSEDGQDFEDEDGDEAKFQHMSSSNVKCEEKKGLCVRNQMGMWEKLLEIRIQLQKCVIAANKMPQKQVFDEIKQASSEEFNVKVTETKNTLIGTLEKLLSLQNLMLEKFPETKSLNSKTDLTTEHEADINDDEEIPSDTESEKSEIEPEPTSQDSNQIKKKRKLADYESEIHETHKKYTKYRNGIIQKWNDKTRIGSIKTNTASHSVLNQIDYALGNKEKLIKRTQLKRSSYEIVGDHTENSEGDDEYNREIFDDGDFYQQLLRDLIEVKSADITDPIQLGKQWIQLHNMRSKIKRNIDTKATKGRKIRYAIHNKLVNFMAPIDTGLWSDEARTELCNSLFKDG